MAQALVTLEELSKLDKASLSTSERRKALELARTIYRQLEEPIDVVVRLCWVEQNYAAGLKICKDLGVFDVLGDCSPNYLSVTDIIAAVAEKGGHHPSPSFLTRILRHLAAECAILAREADEYAATPLTEALRSPAIGGGLEVYYNLVVPTFSAMPMHFSITDYQEPTRGDQTCWQFGKRTPLTFFGYLQEHPTEMEYFSNFMAAYSAGRGVWTDIYPFDSRVLENSDKDGTLVVDIGGGMGQDMRHLLELHPEIAGRLVVQDLESVVAAADSDANKGIQMVVHDFFSPQPIIGARVYFLHFILHDWPDEDSVRILSSIKPVMKPGYSKLIINETVMASPWVDSSRTGLDLCMMSTFAARERDQNDWKDLLEKAGFKITGTWTDSSKGYESVIEAELA